MDFYDEEFASQATVYPMVHGLTYPPPRFFFPIHCLYGVDVHTETGFEYDVDHFNGTVNPPAPAKIRSGDGDGTVNLRSLESCSRWVFFWTSHLDFARRMDK